MQPSIQSIKLRNIPINRDSRPTICWHRHRSTTQCLDRNASTARLDASEDGIVEKEEPDSRQKIMTIPERTEAAKTKPPSTSVRRRNKWREIKNPLPAVNACDNACVSIRCYFANAGQPSAPVFW